MCDAISWRWWRAADDVEVRVEGSDRTGSLGDSASLSDLDSKSTFACWILFAGLMVAIHREYACIHHICTVLIRSIFRYVVGLATRKQFGESEALWFRILEGRLFYSLQLRGVTSAMRIEQVQQAQIRIVKESVWKKIFCGLIGTPFSTNLLLWRPSSFVCQRRLLVASQKGKATHQMVLR